MKRATSFLAALVLGALMLAAVASAQSVGGHDETSEANAISWSAPGAPGPDIAPPPGIATHLLITEIIVTPTPAELIEIHNPTGAAIDLTNYYISDAWFEPTTGPPWQGYHQLPSGTLVVGVVSDFVSRFPAGSSIPAGGTQVIALYGTGVDSTFGGGIADYEITSSNAGIPDMISVGGNAIGAGATTLTNTSECVVLFAWDGLSDLVCDVDYVSWGAATTSSRVDKTGQSVDGPDGDAIATTYNADTPKASQSVVTAPGAGVSVSRASASEGTETATAGNGCLFISTPARAPTWGQVKVRYR